MERLNKFSIHYLLFVKLYGVHCGQINDTAERGGDLLYLGIYAHSNEPVLSLWLGQSLKQNNQDYIKCLTLKQLTEQIDWREVKHTVNICL